MDNQHGEAATIFMKILGAVAAVISFRWIVKIFAGDDGKLNPHEFKKIASLFFFCGAGAFMLYKEGNRTHEWTIYSEWYIAIVFGALLTVLHLDHALDKILKIVQTIKSPPSKEEVKNE